MRFVDTSFWIALFFYKDANHTAARHLWEDATGPLLCSNHVLSEVWTFTRRRGGHGEAIHALDAVAESPRVTHLHVDATAENEAWEWLRRHDDRRYSFVDATSFVIMRQRRITEALAFDGDFAAAGFVEVRP